VPEQTRAKELDRVAIYFFGAVLYEMATGVLPFRGESFGGDLQGDSGWNADAAVRLNPEVPAELERIIDKALEKIAICATRARRRCARTCNG